jgi:hypothetical protein
MGASGLPITCGREGTALQRALQVDALEKLAPVGSRSRPGIERANHGLMQNGSVPRRVAAMSSMSGSGARPL